MDVSKKTLIIAVILNIIIIAVALVCLIVTKWNMVAIWVSLAIVICVLITSIMAFVMGKNFKK